MTLIERGKVQQGGIVFVKLLALPEGSEVVVEPLFEGERNAPFAPGEDFATLPCFGMWRDRKEMSDSLAWTRRQREQWSQRLARQD